jgi:hypothetical protein
LEDIHGWACSGSEFQISLSVVTFVQQHREILAGVNTRKAWVSVWAGLQQPQDLEHEILYSLARCCTDTPKTMDEVKANSQNRAFVGQNPMGFSTSSPSATTGGGQSNSPVSDAFCLLPDLALHFPSKTRWDQIMKIP